MDAFKVRFLCARGRRTLMADIVSPEKRSQNMSAIRSKNTKPEVYLRKLLFAQGYRYRIADKSVPGHPDIFLRRVYLNKKLLHDIVKYTRYSVLFKYTTTTYSSTFNIVSYLQDRKSTRLNSSH